MIAFAFSGRNQEGRIVYWIFAGTGITTCGPYKGGWKCRWERKDLCDLYGYPVNLSVLQLVALHARNWGLKLRRL